jgi:hypothetical protein
MAVLPRPSQIRVAVRAGVGGVPACLLHWARSRLHFFPFSRTKRVGAAQQ